MLIEIYLVIECPKHDAQYPVFIPDKNCEKFWECSQGIPHLFRCTAGLHFNPKQNICDWSENAGCNENSDNEENSDSEESSDSGDNSNSSSSSSSSESLED